MKPRTIKALIRVKEKIERGETMPARVWEILPDGKGGFVRRRLQTKEARRHVTNVQSNNPASD